MKFLVSWLNQEDLPDDVLLLNTPTEISHCLRSPRCDCHRDLHGNSLLHLAIVWNHILAVERLIDIMALRDPEALWCRDSFSGSMSTPLILAAKTANNQAACGLVKLAQNKKHLFARDYKGNTALHYACLLRNHQLIEAIINRNAQLVNRMESPFCELNSAGETPSDLYALTLSQEDLAYPHGKMFFQDRLLHKCDFGDAYRGARVASASMIRWFIANIVENLNLAQHAAPKEEVREAFFKREYYYLVGDWCGFSVKKEKGETFSGRLSKVLKNYFSHTNPVMNASLYNMLIHMLYEYRRTREFKPCYAQTSTAFFYGGKLNLRENHFHNEMLKRRDPVGGVNIRVCH